MSRAKLNYADCQTVTKYLMDRAVNGFNKGIGIAITDAAGQLLSATLMDGAKPRALEYAYHKAYTAAKFEKSTQAFMQHLHSKGFEMDCFCDPKLSPLNGGAPTLNEENEVIGAVGVSGLKGEEDQIVVDECINLLK